MIQNYQTLAHYVDKYSVNFKSSVQCQKVWSSAHYIILRVRLVGRNSFIYLGRGHGYEGFFPDLEPPTPEMRLTDTFQLFLKKYLEGQFLKFSIDLKDRILLIEGTYSSVCFFYKARELFFTVKDQQRGIYQSWSKKWVNAKDHPVLFDYFNELGRAEIEKNSQVEKIDHVFKAEFEFTQKTLNHQSKHRITFDLKKKKNINDDIALLKKTLELKNQFIQIDDLSHLAEISKFTHLKLRVSFKTDESVYKRREKILNKIKDLEKAVLIQEKRALAINSDELKEKMANQNLSQFKFYNPMLRTKNVTTESVKKQGDEQFRTYNFDQFQIGFGLNANGNDQLRKYWANGEDYWVHLDGNNSAHMIIKIRDVNYLNVALKECANIYSKNNNLLEVNLIYCLVKNVKNLKGATGLVTYKKEKRVKFYV